MSMDKKLTAAVYAAVEKAYDHQCDIKDAADEILEIIEADRQRRGISNECEPVGYIMPTALKQLKAGGHVVVGGVSQGFDVPIYTAPQPAEPVDISAFDELIDLYQDAQRDGTFKERIKARTELREAYRKALAHPAEPLMVNAVFETENGEVIGTTDAKVKRVEWQDDGSLTVVIDYWPQPAEPDEWKLAVDNELTNMQSTADSYPSAKEAVKALIDWHVAVATDPVFRQPAEPISKDSDDFFTNDNPKLRGLNKPVKVPSEDERAAQGLSPYNPGHLTEEEWNRLVENGRKAWGKKPSEPVDGNLFRRVEEDEILICTLDGYQYFLGPEYDDELGWDDAKKWCESLGEGYELPNYLVMLTICMNKDTAALLTEGSYWTSTELEDDPSHAAWLQQWHSGSPGLQGYASKSHLYRIRAVRRSRP